MQYAFKIPTIYVLHCSRNKTRISSHLMARTRTCLTVNYVPLNRPRTCVMYVHVCVYVFLLTSAAFIATHIAFVRLTWLRSELPATSFTVRICVGTPALKGCPDIHLSSKLLTQLHYTPNSQWKCILAPSSGCPALPASFDASDLIPIVCWTAEHSAIM